MNLKKLSKFLRCLALAVFRAALILATGILLGSCSSLLKPSFNQMSEVELTAHNLTVASSEQVTCMQVQIDRNQDSEKICGTLEEIQRSIEPVLPGAKINTLRVFSPIESDKNSRSTNPQLKPTVRRPL
ncbi:hypothetical protein N9390_10860 [Gammaproteobacteria bacterium]|nr:hypothetical protein [Gammaproteobacteria bacterium]